MMECLAADSTYYNSIYDMFKHNHFYDPNYSKWECQTLTKEQVEKDFNKI